MLSRVVSVIQVDKGNRVESAVLSLTLGYTLQYPSRVILGNAPSQRENAVAALQRRPRFGGCKPGTPGEGGTICRGTWPVVSWHAMQRLQLLVLSVPPAVQRASCITTLTIVSKVLRGPREMGACCIPE